jgi:hypothetical protein
MVFGAGAADGCDVAGGSGPIWTVQVDTRCPPVFGSWGRGMVEHYILLSLFLWFKVIR